MYNGYLKEYKLWKKHAQKIKSMPYNCQVINTGSTPSYRAFDYNGWGLIGFNLGYQTQPLYYDFETLKTYSDHIASNARILIGIEEFKFLVDTYEEARDHKYYLWLEPKQICTYKKSTDLLVNYVPFFFELKIVLKKIKNIAKKIYRRKPKVRMEIEEPEEIDKEWSRRWMHGWNYEFGWEDGEIITKEQFDIISKNEKRLEAMIDFCYEHNWIPYIIVLPFSPNLTKLLSKNILKQVLWEPLNQVCKTKKVELINLYDDDRFADYRLYQDALTFNEEGKKYFNKIIQGMIGAKILDTYNREVVKKR